MFLLANVKELLSCSLIHCDDQINCCGSNFSSSDTMLLCQIPGPWLCHLFQFIRHEAIVSDTAALAVSLISGRGLSADGVMNTFQINCQSLKNISKELL